MDLVFCITARSSKSLLGAAQAVTKIAKAVVHSTPSVLHRIRKCLVPFGPLQLYQHRCAVISPLGPWAGYMLQAQEYQFSRHRHRSIADSLYFNSTVTVLSQYCHSTVYSTVYSTVSFFTSKSTACAFRRRKISSKLANFS